MVYILISNVSLLGVDSTCPVPHVWTGHVSYTNQENAMDREPFMWYVPVVLVFKKLDKGKDNKIKVTMATTKTPTQKQKSDKNKDNLPKY